MHKAPLKFNLTAKKGQYTVVADTSNPNAISDFDSNRGEKIYALLVRTPSTVCVYVGETARTMRARFNDGITYASSGHQYSWLTSQDQQFRLLVWDVSSYGQGQAITQSIEAELVFCIRIMQWGWPTHQTGIMFRHIVNQSGKQFAPSEAIHMLGDIYDDVISRQPDPTLQQSLIGEKQTNSQLLQRLILPGTAFP